MTTSKRDYTKDIIEEYNVHLQSWGDSDSWGLTEFKMLEDLINESSGTRINANTLKRFFQQKTLNPQVATYNALCIFLGYSGYAEFVMKKTKQTKAQDKDVSDISTTENKGANETESTKIDDQETAISPKNTQKTKRFPYRKYSQISIYIVILLGVIFLFMSGYWDIIKEKYENHLISSIVFESSTTKGASPFTAKIEYSIPKQLMDSISVESVEANGDVSTRKLTEGQQEFYATFIYPGKGLCQLKYKNKVIRTIAVESRTPGWSAYLKEDRTNFYLALPFDNMHTDKGYLTLSLDKISKEVVTDKLFVSYTYYTDSIIDGDNFIFEARVRNSPKEDHGIPCYDTMMYIFSNTGFHGFALNENCYSYLKFISSENTIMGDQHDLSRFNFNPSLWHVMKIEVVDKKTTFYLDGEIVNQMNYNVSLGTANELTLRFKGFGAVDYVKVMDTKNKIVYEKNFGEVTD